MPYLITLNGLPASGKSTLAAMISAVWPNLVVASADGTRDKLQLPDSKLDDVLVIYRRLAEQARLDLENGFDVLLDATFVRQIYREVLFETLHEVNATMLLLALRTSDEKCLERTEERAIQEVDPERAERHRIGLSDLIAARVLITPLELEKYSGYIFVDSAHSPPTILRISPEFPAGVLSIIERACSIYPRSLTPDPEISVERERGMEP